MFHRNAQGLWLPSRPRAGGKSGYPASAQSQSRVFRADGPLPCLLSGEGESYRYLLDTDELQGWADAVILQAEFNDFPDSLHERVEILGLGMAAPQGRNGGDIIAVFIPFDDNGELSLSLHQTILAWKKQGSPGSSQRA